MSPAQAAGENEADEKRNKRDDRWGSRTALENYVAEVRTTKTRPAEHHGPIGLHRLPDEVEHIAGGPQENEALASDKRQERRALLLPPGSLAFRHHGSQVQQAPGSFGKARVVELDGAGHAQLAQSDEGCEKAAIPVTQPTRVNSQLAQPVALAELLFHESGCRQATPQLPVTGCG